GAKRLHHHRLRRGTRPHRPDGPVADLRPHRGARPAGRGRGARPVRQATGHRSLVCDRPAGLRYRGRRDPAHPAHRDHYALPVPGGLIPGGELDDHRRADADQSHGAAARPAADPGRRNDAGGEGRMNHALRRVALACLAMFLLLLVNVNYVQGFEAGKLADYPGNGRTFAQQYQYQRGSIITADNKPIAQSKHVSGVYSFQRYYPAGPIYAPVTGYDTPYSKTGIEQAEDNLLSGTDPRLAVRNLIDLVTGKPRKGATVQLTINSAAQKAAYEALKASGRPSGAVAIDPSTGAILALA